MNFTKPLFHLGIGMCLTSIAIVAMALNKDVISGTALGALGGYVLKNGVFNHK